MNIVTHFFRSARQYPGQIAFVEKSRVITFEETAQKIRQTAQAMKAKGIAENDNIMVMIPVGSELYIHILALFQIGARVVLADRIFPKNRLLYAFKKAQCKYIITTPLLHFFRLIFFPFSLAGKVTSLKPTKLAFFEIVQKSKNDTSLITFTGGTTGKPKPADRTHGFLNIQLQTITEHISLKNGDVHLTSFPVVNMCNLAVGATSVIPPKPNQKKHWHFIQNQPPSVISASEFYYRQFVKELDTRAFEKVFLGGATLFPAFISEVVAEVPPEKIGMIYGSTEAEPIATQTAADFLSHSHHNEKGVLAGRLHGQLKIRILPLDEHIQPEIGEILIAGPHVLENYYQLEGESVHNKIDLDGVRWHKTGDAGYLKNGQLYLMGRKHLMWKENQEWYSPLVFEKWGREAVLSGEFTVLKIKRKLVFFYTDKKMNIPETDALIPVKIDRYFYVPQFPKDKRHQSRIDYEELKNRALKKLK